MKDGGQWLAASRCVASGRLAGKSEDGKKMMRSPVVHIGEERQGGNRALRRQPGLEEVTSGISFSSSEAGRKEGRTGNGFRWRKAEARLSRE